jgi:hypothetical protein
MEFREPGQVLIVWAINIMATHTARLAYNEPQLETLVKVETRLTSVSS